MKKLFLSKTIIIISALFLTISCARNTGPTKVLIKTTAGNMIVELYDDTPKHKANFIKLVKEGYYDGLLFHRVIQNFMIQGGDPDSKNAVMDKVLGNEDHGKLVVDDHFFRSLFHRIMQKFMPQGGDPDSKNAAPDKVLGNGGPGYEIDAEIRPNHFHRKGALAAARNSDDVNPEKKSSGSQFYIVQGKTYTSQELDNLVIKINNVRKTSMFSTILRQKLDKLGENYSPQKFQKIMDTVKDSVENVLMPKNTFSIPEERRQVYMKEGGVPHLDGNYTVFGQVIEGLDVIDKIAAVETDQNDRPKKDVVILTMKIL
ncbi:MAG TPA: peptidylprolyl isomerase [Williamwhitmania sp.]|nr:peptidylprolyl isomerase [Williamwhitmania sp.]